MIDVSLYLYEMEAVLRDGSDAIRCTSTLAILQRWQFDDKLDEASRTKARRLLLEFGATEWGGPPRRAARRGS